VLAETTAPTDATAEPAEAVHAIVAHLVRAAQPDMAQVQACVVLVWIGRGPGSAFMVGDQLLRGTAGAAGELGAMPVPGSDLGSGGFDRSRYEVAAERVFFGEP
jgi:ROK family